MYRPLLLATPALLCLPLAAEPRLATLEYPPYSSQTQAAGGSIVDADPQRLRHPGLHPEHRLHALGAGARRAAFRPLPGALALWPQEIRKERLHASRPLLYSQLGFFVRRDTPVHFTDLSELHGRRVGIVRGYGYPPRILGSGIVTEEAVDDISNLRKLAARRFDLVLLERLVGEHLMAGDSELRGQLIWQEPALERIPLVVGFSAPQAVQPDWAAIFERGPRELHASGEYLRILKRHSELR